jgi:hypothetical protein
MGKVYSKGIDMFECIEMMLSFDDAEGSGGFGWSLFG